MTGTPVARSTSALHSVTTAKLPPTRKDSTIASFSEATSWPSSTVPLPDVLIRKNRAVHGSAALAPRRRREIGPVFPAVAFGSAILPVAASVVAVAIALLLGQNSRPALPERLQAASRHLSDTGLPGQTWHGSISAVPEKAILRRTALAEPITGSLAACQLTDTKRRVECKHHRPDRVQYRAVQTVQNCEDQQRDREDDGGDQLHEHADQGDDTADNQVEPIRISEPVEVLIDLQHPVVRPIIWGNRRRNLIECTVDVAKDRAVVGDDQT